MRATFILKKYKASTLPEILIAIAVLSLTSAIGATIYLNIQQNSQPFIKLKAQELAVKYLSQAVEKRDVFDKTFKEEEFSIRQKIARAELNPDCVVISVSVSNKQEKKICELQQLVYAN